MYWRESHRFLSRTPLKTRVKRKINYPFKWIQSNGNWIVYFKKFDNFRLIHLIAEKLDVFNVSSNFFLFTNVRDLDMFARFNSQSRARFGHVFAKHISKVEIS